MKMTLESLNDYAKHQYIGDWLIDKYNDDNLKLEIHQRANHDLMQLLRRDVSMTEMDSYLYLSLVYIAMECYDQNFYDHLVDYFPEAYEGYSGQLIGNRIREYIKYIRNIEEDDNNRIIDYVLRDAFVPRKYLTNFYRFLYDIFVVDYDFNFPQERDDIDTIIETNKEIRDLLSQIVKRGSSENSEEVTLKVTVNGTYKNYVLIKGTVLALSNEESLQNLTPIIVKMLNLFHADFWGEDTREVALNKYLLYGFNEWKKDNIHRDKQSKQRKSFTRETLKPRILKYNDDKKEVLLYTRRHIINGATADDDFEIQIKNGEKLIASLGYQKLILKRSMGGIKIEPMDIPVKNFLGQLTYSVLHNGKEIYSTLTNLHFEYLIFDNNLRLLPNLKNYDGNALIVSKMKLNNDSFQIYQDNAYYFYAGKLNENTVLDFDGHRVFLTRKFLMKVMGSACDSLLANYNNKQVDVFTELHNLYIDVTGEEVESLILTVNDEKFRLSDVSNKLITNKMTYATINLNSVISGPGYYFIEIVNSRINKEKIVFIYDPMFINHFEVNVDFSINQHISSCFFDTQNIHHTREKLEKEEILYLEKKIEIDGINLKYSLKILVDNYEINNKSYYLSRYIWYPNLTTNLVINMNDVVAYETITNGNTFKKYTNPEQLDYVVISKNDLEFALNESKDGIIWINLKKNSGEVYTILVHKYNIYSKDKYTLISENDGLQIKIKYEGRNKMTLQYNNEFGEKKKLELLNDIFVRIPLAQNVEYELSIVEGESYNPFLMNSEPRIHQKIYHCYLGVDRLMRNGYILKEAYLEEESNADQLRGVVLNGLYYDQQNTIRGILSYHNRDCDVLYEFEDINPVKIEFLAEVTITGSAEETPVLAHITDLDEDGLMLDKYGCSIDIKHDPRHGPVNHFKMIIRGDVK